MIPLDQGGGGWGYQVVNIGRAGHINRESIALFFLIVERNKLWMRPFSALFEKGLPLPVPVS